MIRDWKLTFILSECFTYGQCIYYYYNPSILNIN